MLEKPPRITRAPTAQQAHFVEYLLKSRVPMAKSDLFGATGSLNPHRPLRNIFGTRSEAKLQAQKAIARKAAK